MRKAVLEIPKCNAVAIIPHITVVTICIEKKIIMMQIGTNNTRFIPCDSEEETKEEFTTY